MKRLFVLMVLIVTFAFPARAEELTIYNNFSNDSVKITIPEYKPIATKTATKTTTKKTTTPVVKNSYYDALPKLEDIIKTRKISYLVDTFLDNNYFINVSYNNDGSLKSIDNTVFEYNKDGTYYKIGGKIVIYNDKGLISKIGRQKVTYNNKGQIEKVGLTTIYYDSLNGISHITSPIHEYSVKYKCIDNSQLDVLYKKMLTDKFFNKYKDTLEKYQHYYDLESAKSCENREAISDINDYLYYIKQFKNYYNDYKENIGWHSREYYNWFLSQVEVLEDWMKTHDVDYKNPYEEHYKNKAIRIKTKEELMEEELSSLRSKIKQLESSQEELQRRQNERIYSIGGERVEYQNGRIYSIGGKRVDYRY